MNTIKIVLGLWAGVTLAGAAENSPLPTRSISLQDCLQEALQYNLDVQIQRLNPQIYRYQVSVAYAGYDPNFSISGAHSFGMSTAGLVTGTTIQYASSTSDQNEYRASLGGLLPTGLTYSLSGDIRNQYGSGNSGYFNTTSGSAAISLSQPLLKNFWIDSTRMTIAVNKKTLKKSELQVTYQIMQTVLLVEQAYYDLIAAQENVLVQQKALELAERLLAENKKKVEVGTMAPLDEKQAEAQAASSRSQVINAQQILAQQQNALKKLITDNFSALTATNLAPTETLQAIPQAFSLQDSWHKGLTQRPDLMQQRIELERQDIVLKYQRNQLYPELNLTGGYGHSAGGNLGGYKEAFTQLGEGSAPFYSYGGVLRFPLSNKNARYSYKTSKAQKEQAVLTLKKQEQDVMAAIDDAIKQAKATYERVDSTKQARLYAEAALDAEQKKLEAGKSTSFFVLQLQRDLTSARGTEIQTLADYRKSLAALSFADGSILERHGIGLNVQ